MSKVASTVLNYPHYSTEQYYSFTENQNNFFIKEEC